MNLPRFLASIFAFGLTATGAFAGAPPERSAAAKSIFDGKTLDGWESTTPNLWAVKDGCLTGGDGNKIPYNDFLCTKGSYSNFILHLKIKLTGDPKTGFINSGIQIRTHRNLTGHEVCGYQCDYGEPTWYAAIYDEGRRNRVMKPSDMDAIRPALHLWDWNDYVIKADGKRIQTWINGVQGVDYEEQDADIASDGIIGIQVHGGGDTLVQVKNVYLEELPATPNAPTWDSLGGVEGQREKIRQAVIASKPVNVVADTKAGWSGNTKTWQIKDGTITGEVPAGQTLEKNDAFFWNGELNDFDLTLECRITGGPGASAGIQYRSRKLPDGSAAGYVAKVDDGSEKLGRLEEEVGRKLLSGRGERVAFAPDGRRWADTFAKAETFRPLVKAGDWNRYRVLAYASHVETWLNGTQVSALDDNQVDAAKFSGLLALQLPAGQGPCKVEFRNLRLLHLGATDMPKYANVKPVPPVIPDVPGFKPVGENGKPLNLDFETGTLAGWKAEGNAWEKQPVEGDLTGARGKGPSQHQGKFWIGGYERVQDLGTGTLTSESFVATHPWGSFLIGGGHDEKVERVEVVDEASGKVIFSASGEDRESMRRVTVPLKDFVGMRIFVRLVDLGKSGWGHLNFDDFLLHDVAPAPVAAAPSPAPGGAPDRASRRNESPVLWHLQPNPAKPTAVKNEDAQNVISTMMLTKGFQAELIAAEPEVKQPIAFAMDERGRLWVAEAYAYPKKRADDPPDRILIFEDVDGDGTFKKRTVFYEGLNLVSGMEVGFGGVWVGAAPELIFIPKDANDKAGQPQVLLDGFGYQDTHETLNSFMWGPDGWLYGNQGVFNRSLIGKPGAPDAERQELRSGVWRYHPIRHEFEIFAHGGSNQWGLDFNSNGHIFMTHCRSFWGGGGTTNVIRNGHFWNQANGNYAPFISPTAPDFAPSIKNFLPAAARYDSGAGGAGKPGSDAVYGGHSHVGTMIYLGDNWPEIYRDHLFTNNLFGHQMNQQHSVRVGSGYETVHAGYDLLLAPNPRYMAVDLQTGPDGAVYMIDWCDLQHCHTPMEEKWDRTNGRIYRVSWAATYHPVKVNLGTKSDLELAQLHTHRNEWYTRQSRGLLQERAAKGKIDPQAIAALKEQAALSDVPLAVRALLTLHVIGALDQAQLATFAANPSDIIRSWAIQLATEVKGKSLLPAATLAKLAKDDPSPTVRLAIASALPTLDDKQIWDIAPALAAHGEDKDDRFLPKMIWFGFAPVAMQDIGRALAVAEKTPLPSLAESISWYVARLPAGRDTLIAQLGTQPDDAAERNLRLLAFALKDEARAPMPAAWPKALARFEKTTDASLANAADQLSALFGDTGVLAKMRAVLADEKQPMPRRQFAFDLLKRSGDPEATPIFARLLDVDSFRAAVIPLLSRSNDPATAASLMQRFERFDPVDRSAALGTLTSRPVLALALLHAMQNNSFDRKYLSALQVRQMRNLHDKEVDQLLDQSWGKATESTAETKATIERIKKAYGGAPLWAYDAKAGHETFNQICAVCHALNGVGGKLGPDLAGSWRNGLDYFVENIVDPNAVVGEQYQMQIITKKDGTVLSGIGEQESATAVTLRTVTEAVIIPKDQIKDRQKLSQSVMPPGLLEAMPERKAIELLKFLTSKQ